MNWTTKHALLAGLMVIALLSNGCSDNVSIPELEGLGSVDELTQRRDIAQQRETLGIAKSSYLQLVEYGARVRAELEELRRLQNQWNTQVAALLGNEDGRFVAADSQDVSTFRAHFDTMETVTEESLESLVAELDALITPLQTALNAGEIAGHPDEKIAPRLKALDERIQQTAAPYKRTIPAIESVLANAKSRGTLGTQTLQGEIAKLINAEAQARAVQIEAARKEADEQVTQRLAEATQSLILAKGEKEHSAMSAEEARIRAETVAEALKAKATNPDTLARLKPFVTKTTTKFESSRPRDYRWFPNQTEAAPFSFGALSRVGALEPTQDGIRELHAIAVFERNDRPPWPSASSPEDWEWVKENQMLLRELGMTLVELGFLLP